MMKPIFRFSNICGALDYPAIGTRVKNIPEFLRVLEQAVAAHDFNGDRIPGQGYIELPGAIPYVSAGVGEHTENPDDYVLRLYRGRVGAFLKREKAGLVEGCAAVVYTLDAYLLDPDVVEDLEEQRHVTEGLDEDARRSTFVVVTILAFSGPKSPMSPRTLVRNLAGANHEAQVWDADTIRAKARESLEFHGRWGTVAD